MKVHYLRHSIWQILSGSYVFISYHFSNLLRAFNSFVYQANSFLKKWILEISFWLLIRHAGLSIYCIYILYTQFISVLRIRILQLSGYLSLYTLLFHAAVNMVLQMPLVKHFTTGSTEFLALPKMFLFHMSSTVGLVPALFATKPTAITSFSSVDITCRAYKQESLQIPHSFYFAKDVHIKINLNDS